MDYIYWGDEIIVLSGYMCSVLKVVIKNFLLFYFVWKK